eukprot:TRINITY_DN43202_c0_g1_i2.p1 TRINITY_DN43202_c0_g1~~TRINITY_DN43202_c0_g1_i2.p1  ORF type:complete len:367 (+),score=72.37 TRINITY_DN43202_c0_g1_i2:90-1190(+)
MASEPMRSAARLRILICLTVLSDALRLGNEDDVKEDLAARADTISFLHRTHSGDIRDLPWMNASTEPWSFYFKATCPYAQGIFKMLRRHDALLAFVNRTSMRCFSGFDDEPPSLLTPGGTPRSEAEGEALNPLGFACDKFYSEGEQTVMKELKDAHNGTVDASCRGPDISSTTSPVLKVGETTYCRPATILDWLESNIQNLKTEPLSTLATRNQTSTSTVEASRSPAADLPAKEHTDSPAVVVLAGGSPSGSTTATSSSGQVSNMAQTVVVVLDAPASSDATSSNTTSASATRPLDNTTADNSDVDTAEKPLVAAAGSEQMTPAAYGGFDGPEKKHDSGPDPAAHLIESIGIVLLVSGCYFMSSVL